MAYFHTCMARCRAGTYLLIYPHIIMEKGGELENEVWGGGGGHMWRVWERRRVSHKERFARREEGRYKESLKGEGES